MSNRISLDERFTNVADTVSDKMGRWWVTAIFLVLILVWFLSGPWFHWSDTWQLIVNTPTTIIELFIGFLLAASANRVERHSRTQTDRIEALEQKMDAVVEDTNAIAQADHVEHGRLLNALHAMQVEQMALLHRLDQWRSARRPRAGGRHRDGAARPGE